MEPEPVDPRLLASGPLHVLVVDSRTACRKATVGLLEQVSYKAAAVKTSREALQLCAQQQETGGAPFDIILKEHSPPTVNACRFLRRVLADEALKHTPVIVMSSNGDKEAVMKCLHSGAADYLVQPLRQNELQNLWTKVWWRKVAQHYGPLEAAAQPAAAQGNPVPQLQGHGYPAATDSGAGSLDTRNRRSSDELGSCGGSAEGKEQPSQADKAGSAVDTGLRTSTGGGSGGQDSSRTKLGSRAQTSTSPDPAAGKDGTLVSGPAVHSAGPHQGTAAQAAAAAPLSRAGPVGGAAGSAHRPSCTGQSAAGGAGAGIAGTAGAGGQVAEVQPASGRQPGSEGQAAGAGADPTPAAGLGHRVLHSSPQGFRAWAAPSTEALSRQRSAPNGNMVPASSLQAGQSVSLRLEQLMRAPSTGPSGLSSLLGSAGSCRTNLPVSSQSVRTAEASPVQAGSNARTLGRQVGLPGQQVMPQQQSHPALQQEQPAVRAAAVARGSAGQGYPSGPLGGQQGLMPGAFPGLPFPWAAPSSLPSGEVAEAYAQQLRMAALSMMQASRGPQEEQSNYLGEMAAAQQHLAAMFQQGYNSYMMGSMGPGSAASSGMPPWQPGSVPAAWHQAQLQADQQQQQAQQLQADQRQAAAARRHEQNNAQSRLRPAPPQSGESPGQQSEHRSRAPGPGEDAVAARAEQMQIGRADSAMLGEGSSVARPAACVPLHEGSGSQMARAHSATAAQVHAANLALCVEGPAREMSRAERRLHALNKYKAKRRNMNFRKMIRYESRKQLAEARPRVKGQFVRVDSLPQGSAGSKAQPSPGQALPASPIAAAAAEPVDMDVEIDNPEASGDSMGPPASLMQQDTAARPAESFSTGGHQLQVVVPAEIEGEDDDDVSSPQEAAVTPAGRWQPPTSFGAGLQAGVAALHNGSDVGSNSADEGN